MEKKLTNETLFIGRCAFKGCKYTVRRTYAEIQDQGGWNGNRCSEHTPQGNPHANWPLNWHSIQGIVNAEHICDSRCTNARGHNCECACGGANHGSAYGG